MLPPARLLIPAVPFRYQPQSVALVVLAVWHDSESLSHLSSCYEWDVAVSGGCWACLGCLSWSHVLSLIESAYSGYQILGMCSRQSRAQFSSLQHIWLSASYYRPAGHPNHVPASSRLAPLFVRCGRVPKHFVHLLSSLHLLVVYFPFRNAFCYPALSRIMLLRLSNTEPLVRRDRLARKVRVDIFVLHAFGHPQSDLVTGPGHLLPVQSPCILDVLEFCATSLLTVCTERCGVTQPKRLVQC